jgi:uncharacterized membrane protein
MVINGERRMDDDFEQLLGGRVLAWVGALAIVAGLVLLFAMGISQGWIGEGARTLMGAGVSLSLLLAGAWLHERRGQIQAARAAAAAGTCGLFMAATVASAVYALVPAIGGLALAFVIGAIATVLALRWSSPLMGGLGVLGAVVAPVLVGAPSTTTTIVFEAVAVASAVGVLLRARWDWLLLAVIGLSAPQYLLWLFHTESVLAVTMVPVVFGVLYAAAALGFELRVPVLRLRLAAIGVVALNALMLGVAGWIRLDELGHDGIALLWLAFLSSAHLAGGLAAYRSSRLTPDLGLVCLALSVLLADVAFALTVGGPLRAVGFAAGGVVMALLARRHGGNDGVLAQFGLGGHIAVSALQALRDVSVARAGAGSTGAAAGALVAVAVGCLLSGRLAEEGHTAWRVALDVTGLAALAGVALVTIDGAALTIAFSAQAVALAKVGRRRGDELAQCAAFVHLVVAAMYALFDQVAPAGLVEGAGDVVAAALGGGAVAAATAACAWILPASDAGRRILLPAAPVAVLYVASILVVSTGPGAQGQLLLSALWSVAGVGGLIFGLRRRDRGVRMGAWALLGLAAGKVFLYDLAALESVYRVGSFMALGLLLLTGALAYQRMARQALTA